jgi:hypothetical protein
VKVKFFGAFIFLLSAWCGSIACAGDFKGPHLGAGCEYRKFYGRATITEVRNADPDANNCRDAVEVVFTFSPIETSAPEHYRFSNQPDTGRFLHVGAGMNPPRAWVRSKGLVPGAVHRCIRSEVLKGACTPVVFTFPDIDMDDWRKYCFE